MRFHSDPQSLHLVGRAEASGLGVESKHHLDNSRNTSFYISGSQFWFFQIF